MRRTPGGPRGQGIREGPTGSSWWAWGSREGLVGELNASPGTWGSPEGPRVGSEWVGGPGAAVRGRRGLRVGLWAWGSCEGLTGELCVGLKPGAALRGWGVGSGRT